MKSCTHGSKCADIHVFDKEYKWQYKLPTDDKWASFNGDESSVIEQKYCVVNNDNCAIKISLNKNEVRSVSQGRYISSFTSKPRNYILLNVQEGQQTGG